MDIMDWRVAIRPKTALLEVIDPTEWETFTKEQQNAYQSVRLFQTEQEADKFAKVQVDAAKAAVLAAKASVDAAKGVGSKLPLR